MIDFQPFSHTDYMIVGKTKFLVERCYHIVSRTNLQIDFGTTHLPEIQDEPPNNLSTHGDLHNLPSPRQLNYYL